MDNSIAGALWFLSIVILIIFVFLFAISVIVLYKMAQLSNDGKKTLKKIEDFVDELSETINEEKKYLDISKKKVDKIISNFDLISKSISNFLFLLPLMPEKVKSPVLRFFQFLIGAKEGYKVVKSLLAKEAQKK